MTSLGKKFIVPGLDQPGKQLTFDVDGYFSAASSLNLQQVTTILDKHKDGLNVDVNAVYHETKTRRTKGRVPNKKLRVILQEHEVMSLNYFEVFLTISNNFVSLSCLSCSISVYLSLFWNILVYLRASWYIYI